MSFHKSGIYAKKITRYVPFLNAALQYFVQQFKVLGKTESAKRAAIAMIVTSSATLLATIMKVEDIKNAQTPEEREKAINDAYKYLDKSAYEKTNYMPVS